MALFKSAQARRIERDMEIRRGMQHIRKNLRMLERNIDGYRDKAVRAKRIGANDQLQVLRDAIRRSLVQIRLQERQLLSIETAMQVKNQAEGMSQFARSMAAVARSIGEAFGSADLDGALVTYERAMQQAQSMEERMNIFLDTSADLLGAESDSADVVSDEEIDRLIDRDALDGEAAELDRRIDDQLARLDGACA